jgi:hypothetical protein
VQTIGIGLLSHSQTHDSTCRCDHEQFSALRASELGDGTLEAREIEDCLEYVELLMKRELLTSMNEMIVKNNQIGIYNGCENRMPFVLRWNVPK